MICVLILQLFSLFRLQVAPVFTKRRTDVLPGRLAATVPREGSIPHTASASLAHHEAMLVTPRKSPGGGETMLKVSGLKAPSSPVTLRHIFTPPGSTPGIPVPPTLTRWVSESPLYTPTASSWPVLLSTHSILARAQSKVINFHSVLPHDPSLARSYQELISGFWAFISPQESLGIRNRLSFYPVSFSSLAPGSLRKLIKLK